MAVVVISEAAVPDTVGIPVMAASNIHIAYIAYCPDQSEPRIRIMGGPVQSGWREDEREREKEGNRGLKSDQDRQTKKTLTALFHIIKLKCAELNFCVREQRV